VKLQPPESARILRSIIRIMMNMVWNWT